MDKVTFEAFNRLWTLYKNNLNISPDDPDSWDRLTAAAAAIVKDSEDATDPQFVNDFALSVLESIDRISKHESEKGSV